MLLVPIIAALSGALLPPNKMAAYEALKVQAAATNLPPSLRSAALDLAARRRAELQQLPTPRQDSNVSIGEERLSGEELYRMLQSSAQKQAYPPAPSTDAWLSPQEVKPPADYSNGLLVGRVVPATSASGRKRGVLASVGEILIDIDSVSMHVTSQLFSALRRRLDRMLDRKP